MTSRKTDVCRVIPEIAILAVRKSKSKSEIYSNYIVLHYRSTGNIAPGCDNKDLIAWCKIEMKDELEKMK
jgi:hypothetical protein